MNQIRYTLQDPGFVDVEGDYGFNQMDLVRGSNRYYANRSCAVAGLANLLCYDMGSHHLSRREARHTMRQILDTMPPMPWGIFRLGRLNLALRQLGFQTYLKPYVGPYQKREVINYLTHQVCRDKPVLMLNTIHPDKRLKLHWITITGLIIEGEKVKIQFSSWGRRYTYRYEEIFAKNAGYRILATLDHK